MISTLSLILYRQYDTSLHALKFNHTETNDGNSEILFLNFKNLYLLNKMESSIYAVDTESNCIKIFSSLNLSVEVFHR